MRTEKKSVPSIVSSVIVSIHSRALSSASLSYTASSYTYGETTERKINREAPQTEATVESFSLTFLVWSALMPDFEAL